MTKQAEEYLAKKERERDDNVCNFVGMSCGVGIMICLIVIFLMLLANVRSANAGGLDNWNIRIMGIDYRDFEDRNPWKVIGGGILSVAAHEVLGHMLASEMTGMGHPCFCTQDGYLVAQAGDGYYDASDDQRAWFSASGLIVQSLGSVILTSIPKTRHSDWTLGWNVATTVTGFQYAIFDGGNDDISDTVLMEANGWPGTEIAYGTGIIGGITTYISLDKD